MAMGSEFIHTRDFRIKFLRAERYDAAKAAVRLCKCLHCLQKWYGDFALVRPLYLTDLEEQSLKFLKEGYSQLLPTRDRSGRRVIVQVGSFGPEYEEMAKIRAMTYLALVASQDETTQRKGLIILTWVNIGIMNAHMKNRRNGRSLNNMKDWLDSLPVRFSGFHGCMPNEPIYNILKALYLTFFPREHRPKIRVHSGTNVEIEYSLRQFGIPVDDIPRTPSGSVKTKNAVRFLKIRTAMDNYRKQQECALKALNNGSQLDPAKLAMYNRPFPGIECPDLHCVLFRKSGVAWDHPGNVEFRSLIQEREADRSKQKTLMQKDAYLHGIIQEAYQRGFRFLLFDSSNNWYTEILDYETVRKHVFQAVRDQTRRSRARKNLQTTKSSTRDFAAVDGSKRPHGSMCGFFTAM